MNDEVTIVGLGYVGLPVLLLCSEKGLNVKGYDIDEDKIRQLKNGKSHINDEKLRQRMKKHGQNVKFSTDEGTLEGSDYYVIAVPSPLRQKEPDYSYIEAATRTVKENLEPGSTVILESTVGPRTVRKRLKPILEEDGLEVGEDVYLAFCPERVDPGNREWPIKEIPRVLGAYSEKGRRKAQKFYSEILDSEIYPVSSLEVAEASKLIENTFRDVNIALVNQLAKGFEKIGVDTNEAIEAANTKPFAFIPHYPGCGVGGHCIPIDPYYLVDELEEEGFDPSLISQTRKINDSMPGYTVNKIVQGLNEVEKPVKNTEITVLGLAYKGGVDDKKESPAYDVIDRLEELGADVNIFDPYLLEESTLKSLEEAVESKCLVIVTSHEEFKQLEEMELEETRVIIDGRNILDEQKIEGVVYEGIGR